MGEAHILDYNKYLHSVTSTNKSIVVLTQLTRQEIRDQTTRVPHWSKLDPYSSLEELSSAQEDTGNSCETVLSDRIQTRYTLREWTRSYRTLRQRHSTTSNVFYRGMCTDKKKAMISGNIKKDRPGLKTPSKDRIAAQQKITENLNGITPPVAPTPRPDTKHRSVAATPRPSAKSEADARNLINSYPLFENDKSDVDSDATIDYDIPKDMLPVTEPTPKGKLVMSKTFGIKRKPEKHKRKRNYQCPMCPEHYANMVDFNKHFKSQHDPLDCKVCNETFSTPSALHQHRYKHKDLRYACSKFGKSFPFSSDLDNHEISHRKVKMHHCIHPGCDKSYLRKGELTAHALMHKKGRLYRCRLCKYTSPDQRNLKAHMRVHSNLKRYLCTHCSKLFRYDTQLQ